MTGLGLYFRRQLVCVELKRKGDEGYSMGVIWMRRVLGLVCGGMWLLVLSSCAQDVAYKRRKVVERGSGAEVRRGVLVSDIRRRSFSNFEKIFLNGTTHIGFLETQMRGLGTEEGFCYYVYGKDFEQPVGFFLEDGKTYRYFKTLDGRIGEDYLGAFSPQGSVSKLLKVKGKITWGDLFKSRGERTRTYTNWRSR